MERQDDQPLWDLMGRTAQPEVSPFFARDVLRRVREEQSRKAFSWFSWRRLVPVTALAGALALVAFFALNHPRPHPPASRDDDLVTKVDVQDYDVVTDLDELLATDENNLWDDNSSL